MPDDDSAFDFEAHARSATVEYLRVQPFYADFADAVSRIMNESIKASGIKIHSVQARAKDPNSFSRKASTPSDTDPSTPKYPDPLEQITDLAGVRIITQFLGTVADVDALINQEFDVVEKSNKGLELIEEDRFGYQSIHYLVKIKSERAGLAEYRRFKGAIAEIQVRTVLQHAWAEIEHDIQYKSSEAIPTEIHRRFMALAGMLEIADREFQAIGDADQELQERARTSVQTGNLESVEITPQALKLFLDKRLGPDERISSWTYDFEVRLLKALGFRDLNEIQSAIAPYNDRALSVAAEGGQQGQISRFEVMIEAALGAEHLLRKHLFRNSEWYRNRVDRVLGRLEAAGVSIGTYQLPTPPTSAGPG